MAPALPNRHVRRYMPPATPPASGDRFQQSQFALFGVSVLKQAKWRALSRALGDEVPDRALDLGADNGVISALLRRRGGAWTSADLTDDTVDAIRRMVQTDVHRLHGSTLPFDDESFDLIMVVDLLEHVEDDRQLLREMDRCLRPGGRVILSLPTRSRFALLPPIRHALGLTDEWHGHRHAGYDRPTLIRLLPPGLSLVRTESYSHFFSHLLDTALNWRFMRMHRGRAVSGAKGMVVTGDRIDDGALKTLRLAYWPMRAFAALDALFPWTRGYMMIAELRKSDGRIAS